MHATWDRVFRRRDRRPIYEWAADRLALKPPYTITGAFDVSRSRHFIKILDALQDDSRRKVNIRKPVRSGGSLICDIHFAWAMAEDPGPYLNCFQNDDIAESHLTDKLENLLRDIGHPPPRKSDWKEYKPCGLEHTIYTNGPSINQLQSRGIRYIRLSECWLYKNGTIGEAYGRIGDFLKLGTSKFICESQGGPAPGRTLEECDWHRHFLEAEIWEWTVQCQGCGKHIQPTWSARREDGSFAGMQWDKIKLPDGTWDVDAAAATAHYDCPHCGHPHIDSPRLKSEWNRTGEWTRTTKEWKEDISFHWNALIDWPWGELVKMYLNAQNAFRFGTIEPLQIFHQKYMAEDRDEESLLEGGIILTRVAATALKPEEKLPGELGRGMAIDRQDEDTYWWQCRAFLDNGKSMRLGWGKAFGWQELEEIRIKHGVSPNHTLIDSGFQAKGHRGVYSACIRYGWIAVKGDEKEFFVHRQANGKPIVRSYAPLTYGDPEIGEAGARKRAARLIVFSKPTFNQRVQTMIERGLWQEPTCSDTDPLEQEYQRQMAGRQRRTEYNKKTNVKREYWWESKNDHMRDLANILTLFAVLGRHLPDIVEEQKTT